MSVARIERKRNPGGWLPMYQLILLDYFTQTAPTPVVTRVGARRGRKVADCGAADAGRGALGPWRCCPRRSRQVAVGDRGYARRTGAIREISVVCRYGLK